VYGEKKTKDATTAWRRTWGRKYTREGGRRVQGDTKCVGQCGVKCGESARTRYPVRRWRACGGIEGGEAAQARGDERYERLRSPSGAAHLEGRVCATWDMWQVERERCVTVEVARKTLCEAKLGPYRSRARLRLTPAAQSTMQEHSLSGCGFHPHHNPPTSPNLSASSKPLYLVQAFFRFSPQ
jgi:hypothetical protein